MTSLLDADTNNRKRPRSDFVTDTPDYKQTKTIITKRQERVRKKFSLHTVVPDTPVKSAIDIGNGGAISTHQVNLTDVGDRQTTTQAHILGLRSTEISCSRAGAGVSTSLINRFALHSPFKKLN
jgi:hypothetical protein